MVWSAFRIGSRRAGRSSAVWCAPLRRCSKATPRTTRLSEGVARSGLTIVSMALSADELAEVQYALHRTTDSVRYLPLPMLTEGLGEPASWLSDDRSSRSRT